MNYTYNELLKYILEGNNIYEEKNGIKTISLKELIKSEDISFISVEKSDNTKTLIVLFKLSRKGDIWNYVTPSENQVNFLKEHLTDYYKAIDINNFSNKKPLIKK